VHPKGGSYFALGACYESLGQLTKAIEVLEQGRALCEELVDHEGLTIVNGQLKRCHELKAKRCEGCSNAD
jgi:hypothetical protein